MYSIWTKHISNPTDKQRFESRIQGSKKVFERIIEILDEREKDLETLELTLADFDLPNWAEKQAYRNGARSVIRSIRKLLTLDQQKEVTNG